MEYISFHIESDENIEKNLQLIKEYGIKSGLAISPDTEIKELVPYLPLLNLVLVMSVEPGAGGQDFIVKTKDKIKELKILLSEYNSDVKISVDGGVNDVTKEYCTDCDILVSGSYIINGDDLQEKIDSLR